MLKTGLQCGTQYVWTSELSNSCLWLNVPSHFKYVCKPHVLTRRHRHTGYVDGLTDMIPAHIFYFNVYRALKNLRHGVYWPTCFYFDYKEFLSQQYDLLPDIPALSCDACLQKSPPQGKVDEHQAESRVYVKIKLKFIWDLPQGFPCTYFLSCNGKLYLKEKRFLFSSLLLLRQPSQWARTSSFTRFLDHTNPVHIPTSHLLEIHPNIIPPSTPRSTQYCI